MAASIGGTTLHTAAEIPANDEAAAKKLTIALLSKTGPSNEPKTNRKRSKTNRTRIGKDRKRRQNDRKRRRNEAFEFDSNCQAPQRAWQFESNSNATEKMAWHWQEWNAKTKGPQGPRRVKSPAARTNLSYN